MKRLLAFVGVGAVSALVHFAVLNLVLLRLPALTANAVGFAAAFAVSFLGQQRLTFARHEAALNTQQALPRWLAVSLGGFALNELVYAGLLSLWPEQVRLNWLAATAMVAMASYALAKHWAFRA